MSNVNMEASTILPVLKKKLAFLSGRWRVVIITFAQAADDKCLLSDGMFSRLWLGVLQGGKTGAAVWSSTSPSVQIRPAWRSWAPHSTICSAFPGTGNQPYLLAWFVHVYASWSKEWRDGRMARFPSNPSHFLTHSHSMFFLPKREEAIGKHEFGGPSRTFWKSLTSPMSLYTVLCLLCHLCFYFFILIPLYRVWKGFMYSCIRR